MCVTVFTDVVTGEGVGSIDADVGAELVVGASDGVRVDIRFCGSVDGSGAGNDEVGVFIVQPSVS
jgi:hypothetical protein